MPVQIGLDAFTDRTKTRRFNSRTANNAATQKLTAFFRAFRKHALSLMRKELLPKIKAVTPVKSGKLAASIKIRQRSKKNAYINWTITSDVFYAPFVTYRGARQLKFTDVIESILRQEMPSIVNRAATAAIREVNLAN